MYFCIYLFIYSGVGLQQILWYAKQWLLVLETNGTRFPDSTRFTNKLKEVENMSAEERLALLKGFSQESWDAYNTPLTEAEINRIDTEEAEETAENRGKALETDLELRTAYIDTNMMIE
jgi:hypothetical protein